MNVDRIVIRLPKANDEEIRDTETQSDFQSVSERLDQGRENHDQRQKKVVKQVNQDVQWVVVGSVQVVLVVFQLLDHRLRNLLFLFWRHFVANVLRVGCEDLETVDSCGHEEDDQMHRKGRHFQLLRRRDFGLRVFRVVLGQFQNGV